MSISNYIAQSRRPARLRRSTFVVNVAGKCRYGVSAGVGAKTAPGPDADETLPTITSARQNRGTSMSKIGGEGGEDVTMRYSAIRRQTGLIVSIALDCFCSR